jgi:peptide/nickel transport system substrate-binding protein
MMRRRILLALLAGALMATGAVQAPAQTPKYGGTLNVGFPSDSKTFDPIFSVEATERQVLYVIYNTLVRYGTDFSIHPELAESWTVEDGGKRIVFKLRQGVKFHDGTDFNAAAVKWNIDRRLDPAVNSPQKALLEPVIASVEAPDAQTAVFNLKSPYPGLLSLLGERPGFMVSPAAVAKSGQDFGSNPVGTGPFVFKEWVRGSRIEVTKNASYWDKGKPYLDRIVFRDIAGSVVGAQRLISGEIDYVGDMSPQDVRQIENRPEIKLYPITVGRWYSLQWHWDKPPFDNPKLRQAIAHAIDRKRLNDILMLGKGTVSEGPTPPGLWWYDEKTKSYDYDPAKAHALVAEAGYPNGFEFTLSTPQVAVFQQMNQLIQEQFAAANIRVKLDPVAQGEWYSRLVKRATNFSPTRWTQRADPDGLLYILFHSKGFANTTNYRNDKVDSLLDQARSIFDMEARKKLYSEAQQLIAQDVPMLPLFNSVEYGALRTNVQGFEWIPDQMARFRYLWKSN